MHPITSNANRLYTLTTSDCSTYIAAKRRKFSNLLALKGYKIHEDPIFISHAAFFDYKLFLLVLLLYLFISLGYSYFYHSLRAAYISSSDRHKNVFDKKCFYILYYYENKLNIIYIYKRISSIWFAN